MDITRTVEPKSDQLNYDDVAAESMVITITEVKQGPPDQPVELHNAEHPGRPYKPGKSMRRVLLAAWGRNSEVYVGRKIRLYGDPTITFGKDAVGGIRISHLSHIEKELTIPLTVTRGRRAPFVVRPLTDPLEKHFKALTEATSVGALQAAWAVAMKAGVSGNPELVALKEERKAELSPGTPGAS